MCPFSFILYSSGPQHFWHQGVVLWKTVFPEMGWEWREWFRDDSSALHLLCTLFWSLWHQLHLRSSGIRSQRLVTPALGNSKTSSSDESGLACILLVMQDGVQTRPRFQSQATVSTLHFCPFYTLTLASYIKSELPFLFCKTGLEIATLRYRCKN